MSPKDAALYRAVDEVLHYIWDPIGVSDAPQARDEYHGYLPQVFAMVRDGAASTEVAAQLGRIATEAMGLFRNSEHDLKVASILLDWKLAIDEKFGQ